MAPFERDPGHWLFRYDASEWIRIALAELRRAQGAYARGDPRGGLACAKRAAGMALNAALIVEPNDGWGRSFVDHVMALGKDESVPERVRAACKLLLETHAGGRELVALRSKRRDERILEATKDVMAHAYAIVKRNEPENP